jgi:hypothetical protein
MAGSSNPPASPAQLPNIWGAYNSATITSASWTSVAVTDFEDWNSTSGNVNGGVVTAATVQNLGGVGLLFMVSKTAIGTHAATEGTLVVPGDTQNIWQLLGMSASAAFIGLRAFAPTTTLSATVFTTTARVRASIFRRGGL